jgi:hypothetical protein
MDSMFVFRASWKVRLVAFGLGILVAAAAFGIALGVSDDLRLLYVSGALLLAFAAFLLGAPAREDLIAAVQLLFASTFLFAFFVLSQTPFLWPTHLWMAIVVWLLFRKRFARIITIVGAMILIAVSAWYCASYIPVQMQRALTHVGNGAALPFTLQPISQSPVPIRSTPGKILVLDFFATWCLHVLQSCRNWSVFVPIFRLAAISNSSLLAPIAAVIHPSGCAHLRDVAKFPCRWHLIPIAKQCAHLV